jgi:hypothetical protein
MADAESARTAKPEKRAAPTAQARSGEPVFDAVQCAGEMIAE